MLQSGAISASTRVAPSYWGEVPINHWPVEMLWKENPPFNGELYVTPPTPPPPPKEGETPVHPAKFPPGWKPPKTCVYVEKGRICPAEGLADTPRSRSPKPRTPRAEAKDVGPGWQF